MDFFSKAEIDKANMSMSGIKGQTCQTCGLYKNVNSPRMKPFGNFRKRILNIGNAPGEWDDRKGKPWQGKPGKLLQRTYQKFGIDLFEDCLNINAIGCRPLDENGRDRKPTPHEIACCKRKVSKVIYERNPRVIILLGNTSIQSIIGTVWKNGIGGIAKWRGWSIPDQTYNAWVCSTFHPSYVDQSEQEIETIWKQDLKQALQMWEKPLPQKEDFESQVQILSNPKDIHDSLLSMNMGQIGNDLPNIVATDFETTGLKPHAKEQRLRIISLCDAPNRAIVFKKPKSLRLLKMLKAIYQNPEIGKTAWNMKFEHSWTKVKLGYDISPWVFDPMLGSHVEDNRTGITGLKFQTYRHFGIAGYDEEVHPYLIAPHSNDLNQIDELIKLPGGLEKLQIYCGLDSLFEYRIAVKMMKEMGVL